jgi:peptidoglycan/xylan/chitin deacetylase (PgdA/CDA1 family)
MSGRIRSIKPEVGKNADLWDLGVETGLPVYQAFTMLWCHADREGRFKWKPRELKTDILPYFDGDCAAVLDALASRGFIARYTVDGVDYGWIPTFATHQKVNHREPASKIPPPRADGDVKPFPGMPGHARVEGKGRDLEGEWEGINASCDADAETEVQLVDGSSLDGSPPTRRDNHIPDPPARAPSVPPAPRRGDFRTLRPPEWSPSDPGVTYARELGLDDRDISETITELRNWKGTRAYTVDWWDTKWNTFVQNRAKWKNEPGSQRRGKLTHDPSEAARAREAMDFLRGDDEPVLAEVVG